MATAVVPLRSTARANISGGTIMLSMWTCESTKPAIAKRPAAGTSRKPCRSKAGLHMAHPVGNQHDQERPPLRRLAEHGPPPVDQPRAAHEVNAADGLRLAD